jgi:hypothetical protein
MRYHVVGRSRGGELLWASEEETDDLEEAKRLLEASTPADGETVELFAVVGHKAADGTIGGDITDEVGARAAEPPTIRSGSSGPTRSSEQEGEILEVVGVDGVDRTRKYRVSCHGLMQVADSSTPVAVRVHIGAVIKVQHSDTRFDLCVVEEDADGHGEPIASLTRLRLVD